MEARLGAINSPQITGWGPGRYIAFTKTAIELTPGVDGIDSDDHVVGRIQPHDARRVEHGGVHEFLQGIGAGGWPLLRLSKPM